MTDDLILDIDTTGLQDVLADVDAFPQDVARELTIAMESALQFVEKQVAARTPVNEGFLRGSINHLILSYFPDIIGEVTTPMDYAIVIERGRKPGSRMPPIDAIQQWAVRKLGLSPDEAASAAWGIAKSIAKHGFSEKGEVGPRGKRMFEEGFEVSKPYVNTLFDNAIARSVARFNAS
jgi:hypothetical protein